MTRWPFIAVAVAVVTTAPRSAMSQPERTNQIGANLTHEFGVFMVSHTKVGAALSRLFGDRLHVGANASVGTGPDVVVHEETVQAGLVLHPSARIDVLMAWRFGYTYFKLGTVSGDVGIHALTFEPVFRFDYRIRSNIDVTFAPLVLSGFWSRAWGTNLAVELGLAYNF